MTKQLGRVSERKGERRNDDLLYSATFASATGVQIFWNDTAPNFYEHLHCVLTNFEKPSTAGLPAILFSSNGASLESGAGYNFCAFSFSATTALLATGAINGVGIPAMANTFTLATASGNPGTCRLTLTNWAATGQILFNWEWDSLNSASSPMIAYGNGNFATGPVRGISFGNLVSNTWSGDLKIFGRSKI